MTVKEKLDFLKEHFGASATGLAKGSGVDRATLAKFMNGSRSMTQEKQDKVNEYINQVIRDYILEEL